MTGEIAAADDAPLAVGIWDGLAMVAEAMVAEAGARAGPGPNCRDGRGAIASAQSCTITSRLSA